eukprot:TRINITY_DN2043_c0_g1_i4.p1 TRINITY_DN2043_c0_g1~~TRINITY_DN2043_c0_g1_i4.p1  ORF type:complete len:131 (-),score=37.83 TRINITY_DN2043_c0_g1_i4:54-446(-)
MTSTEYKPKIEDEALAFFEDELRELDDRCARGDLRPFGTSEGKLFSHVDNLLHSATDLALRCLQVEMEHPNVVKDEEKDFGDFKESEFDSIYRKFTEKEEEMSKLREQLGGICRTVTQVNQWMASQGPQE